MTTKSKKLSLKIVNTKNKYKDIINMTEKITWSGDYKQACRKLEFSVSSSLYDKNVPKFEIKEGYEVYFYEGDIELFRGFVYTISKKTDENIEYTAYDHAQKLVDIKVSYNFKEKTAKEITETILDDYKDNGLAKGTIVNDDVSYDKVFINVSAYETIMSAYTNAYYDNGIEYMCYSFGGKIYTAKKGDVRLKVKFQESNNIISVDYSSSIENMVNKVLVVDSSGNEQGHISNNEDIKQFGLFQEIYKIESNKDTEDEGKKLIKEEEQTASLEGYGDTTCITGYGVTVKDEYTGLDGLFYIDTDSHTWQNGEYKISLSLNFKNLMNEVSAGEDEQKEEDTSNNEYSTDDSTSEDDGGTLNGKKVPAEFTAYYPYNSTMEGGYYSSNGEKLDPSSNTCAVPHAPFEKNPAHQIAYGTKIQILGTGTSCDGKTYRANDNGGAIKYVNGRYRIDILMATSKQCNTFGRRKGYIIIGDGTGYKKSSNSNSKYSTGKTSSEKAKKALALAESKVGGKYVYATQGPNTFDCSGLTWWCYKQVGISLPRSSSEQSRVGKKISVSNLQAGDLIFFDTESAGGKNTGRVSHVGMYIGNGKFVHASNPKYGIRYSYLSDWGDWNHHKYYQKIVVCRRVV